MAGGTRTDEGPLLGATLALTLYGLVVIVASVFHVELIPEQGYLLGATMVAFLVVGAVVGALADARVHRR